MRKSHRLTSGNNHPHQYKLVALLITLPILALFLLLQSIGHRRAFTTNSSSPIHLSAIISLPKLAYFISGTRGDSLRLKRLFKAVYHPWNYYLLQIDLTVSSAERRDLIEFVGSELVFANFGNVRVIENVGSVTVKGPTVMSYTLQAAAILLREFKDWNWFMNLDAADYPLMSQDDILHIFSFLPRDLNFVEHTSDILLKEARPIIVDPGLYGSDKADVLWVKDKRSLPSSFKLFTGSSSVTLSWQFIEFCILGWDNLPRTLLMYYTNFPAAGDAYFHTVICNSVDFQNTTVNHSLRFVSPDEYPRRSPENSTADRFSRMAGGGAPFMRLSEDSSSVLDRIDAELLNRSAGRFVSGGWCVGRSDDGGDPCEVSGRADVIKPSGGSRRLEGLIMGLLDSDSFRPRQCK